MSMKRTRYHFLQKMGRRLLFCTMAATICTLPAMAQNEDEETMEVETAIKQPQRKVVADKFATVNLKGVVTEMGSNQPLPGVQLQALGFVRYSAMTEENGSFTIKVPEFATALYVKAPGYMPQQVAIVPGDPSQTIAIKMMKDKFQPMYGTGTDYTAKAEAGIDRFGLTVDNEMTGRLGGDVRMMMRSAALDGGASMFIRGLNSITSDAQPLIVLDGVELDMQRDRYSLNC